MKRFHRALPFRLPQTACSWTKLTFVCRYRLVRAVIAGRCKKPRRCAPCEVDMTAERRRMSLLRDDRAPPLDTNGSFATRSNDDSFQR
jgi:hypothetical protein